MKRMYFCSSFFSILSKNYFFFWCFILIWSWNLYDERTTSMSNEKRSIFDFTFIGFFFISLFWAVCLSIFFSFSYTQVAHLSILWNFQWKSSVESEFYFYFGFFSSFFCLLLFGRLFVHRLVVFYFPMWKIFSKTVISFFKVIIG